MRIYLKSDQPKYINNRIDLPIFEEITKISIQEYIIFILLSLYLYFKGWCSCFLAKDISLM